MSKNSVKQYVKASRVPMRFDKLRPGSVFYIVSEPSRGIKYSNDHRIYQKASKYDGFYAFHTTSDLSIVLMPGDIVQPLKLEEMR